MNRWKLSLTTSTMLGVVDKEFVDVASSCDGGERDDGDVIAIDN